MAKVKTTITTEDNATFVVIPEMRNGMICWRQVATNN